MDVLKRLAPLPLMLLVISFVAFVLIRLAPGGPFDRERRPPPEVERQLKAKYHLDEPWWRQYLRYTQGLLQGDFGPSLKYRHHTVRDIITQALPVSLTLGILAFLLAQGVGVPVGFLCAAYRGRWPDWLGTAGSVLATCIPSFVIGPLLILALAIFCPLFPAGLWESPRHWVLPVLALGTYFAGKIARLTREGVLSTLQEPYIATARAKGLDELTLLRRHTWRAAIVPVVSYSGPVLADLLTGSFVVENIFRIPGLGVFFVNSSLNRDYPMVVGLTLLYSVLLLSLNLLTDLSYRWLDPRLKVS